MQYISKYNFRKKGHAIFRKFLRQQWDKEAGCYFNLNYKQLKRNKSFEHLLINEQHGFCCYCMRHLGKGEVTLEHVMPQNIKNKIPELDIKYYAQYGRLKRKYVKYLESIPKDKRLKIPPYPHSIAYENIVASCTGKVHNEGQEYALHQCCNNFRGNKKIIPFFFIPKIEFKIGYRNDGTIDYPERFDDTVESLNLKHPSLVFIRKIWAAVVKADITVKDVQKAQKDMQLREDIISDIDIVKEERKKLKNDIYWNLLNEFYWFHGYYKKRTKYR